MENQYYPTKEPGGCLQIEKPYWQAYSKQNNGRACDRFQKFLQIKRMGLSSFFQRQRKRKGRAFAFFAFEINTTSVSFDNFFTDIKPQSQAGKSIFAHPEKAAKYFWLIGYRNSYPKIPHRKNDVLSRFF